MNITKKVCIIMAAALISVGSLLPAGAEEIMTESNEIGQVTEVQQEETAADSIITDETAESSEEVAADSEDLDEVDDDIISTTNANIDYANDPLYLKYSKMPKFNAVYGSAGLTHNARFANTKKVYGIDVSYFNTIVDWNAVKKAGIDYAIIRLGYRGYGNGALVVDEQFKNNLKNAKAAGVAVGIYFFTQAITTAEAVEEARFTVQQLNGAKLEMPIYIDIEEIGGRLDNAHLSYNAKTNICKAFCNTIIKSGYRAGVYASYNWYVNLINGPELAKYYDIWLAHYATSTPYTGEYQMWQYTGQGYVNGIIGNVDLDVYYMYKGPAAVTDLKCAQNGAKAKLTWTKSLGAHGYKIYAKNLATNKLSEVADTTATSLTVNIPYAKTRFYVKAYYKIGSNYAYSGYSSGVDAHSTKVSDLAVDADTYYGRVGIALKWTKLYDASGYRVEMYDTTAGKYKVLGYTTSNKYTVMNLKIATGYKFRVISYYNSDKTTAYNSSKSTWGTYSDVLYVGTKTGQVVNVKAAPVSDSQIKVSWEKISEKCDGYQVVFKDEYTGKSSVYQVSGKDSLTYTAGSLAAGRRYKITVRAYYLLGGKKMPGVFADYIEMAPKCAAPKNFKVSKQTKDSCVLAWDKVSGANGYKVYEYIDNKYELVDVTKDTKLAIDELDMLKVYKYRVWPYRTFEGKDHLGVASSLLTVDLLEKPSGFKVTGYTDNSVSMTWKTLSGADKYEVYVYSSATKAYKKYKTVTKSNCTVSGLKKNTYYYVKVRALYNGQYSKFSAAQLISTKCSTPTGFRRGALGSTYQKLSWKHVAGSTGYWIYKYNPSTKKFYKFKEVGKVTSVTLTGLKRNSEHRYKIYAVRKTALRTYISSGSAVLVAWTAR